MGIKRGSIIAASGAGLALALGAAGPNVLSQVSGGLWEVSGLPGQRAQRLCFPQPTMLAQIEHNGARCARTVLRGTAGSALITYQCANGDFGHSEITVLTPRSVRINTQGIASGAPFGYVAQARRVGPCQGR